jgi:hypothetical protein
MGEQMITAKAIRQQFYSSCTLGLFELWLGDALLYECYTCEDVVRGDGDAKTVSQWKVKGESAIPYGTYPLRLTYSQKYGENVWEVCDVPGFKGIRIHAGNTEKDTEGCLLLGEYCSPNLSGITNSRAAIKRFKDIMKQYSNADAVIEIIKGEA